MVSLIVGVVALVLGLVGIIAWRGSFLIVLKGALPPILILVGALALFLGLDTMREKKPEEPSKNDKPSAPAAG